MKHYLLVSHCNGKAYRTTRRLASGFLNRVSEKTWEGHLSQEALSILVTALKAKATRLSCIVIYETRSYGQEKVIHIGNIKHYSADGDFAFSQSTITDKQDFNQSPITRLVSKCVEVAGLKHDLGKAVIRFQGNLDDGVNGKNPIPNPIRHEVLSALLANDLMANWSAIKEPADIGRHAAFTWPTLLANYQAKTEADMHSQSQKIAQELNRYYGRRPANNWEAISQGISWLILSHHRLPEGTERQSGEHPSINYTGSRGGNYFLKIPKPNEQIGDETQSSHRVKYSVKHFNQNLALCDKGQPFMDSRWQSAVFDCLKRLEKMALNLDRDLHLEDPEWSACLAFMGRPALVYADYIISSEKKPSGHIQRGSVIYANTTLNNGRPEFADTLLTHLLGVGERANRYFNHLFMRKNAIIDQLPGLSVAERNTILYPLNRDGSDSRYAWQDAMRKKLMPHRGKAPFFASLMGKTGSGKTRGNMMLMHSLCDQLRFSCAIGLRSLVKQTFDAYQQPFIGLKKDHVALLIGEAGGLQEDANTEIDGTGNSLDVDHASLIGDYILEGQTLLEHDLIALLDSKKQRAMLCNPVQVMTVDHIMPGASLGRSVELKLLMHLMSTDIVLDEIDDYAIESQVALSRMAFIAGLFGRRFVISSATASPIIQKAFFENWKAGIERHAHLFRFSEPEAKPFAVLASHVEGHEANVVSLDAFNDSCLAFTQQVSREAGGQARHRLDVLTVPVKAETEKGDLHALYRNARQLSRAQHEVVVKGILQAHHHHKVTGDAGISVSSGFVRFNNVSNAQHLARALHSREHSEALIIPICYHSQMTAWERREIEDRLLMLNNRKDQQGISGDAIIFHREVVKRALEQAKQLNKSDVIFVLCTTNIIEVGRDHDYDWAILEPSSTRSLVQSCGRVWRHRKKSLTDVANVWILSSNVKALCGAENGLKKGKDPIATWSRHGIEDDTWGKESIIRLRYPLTKYSASALKSLGIDAPSANSSSRSLVAHYRALIHTVDLFSELTNSTGKLVHAGLCLEIPHTLSDRFMTSLEMAQQQLHLFGYSGDPAYRYDKPSAQDYANKPFEWVTSHHADRRYLREASDRYHAVYNAEQNGFREDGNPHDKWVVSTGKESQWVKLTILESPAGTLWLPLTLQDYLEGHPDDSDFRASFIALRKDQVDKAKEGKLAYLPGIGLMDL